MKRMIVLVGVLVLLAGLYIAMPFVTAWRMREAVKAADIAYLADKVEWHRVKETLKVSLAAAALDLPASDLAPAGEGATDPATYARVVGRDAEAVTRS